MKPPVGRDPQEAGCLARYGVCPTPPLLDMVGAKRKPVKQILLWVTAPAKMLFDRHSCSEAGRDRGKPEEGGSVKENKRLWAMKAGEEIAGLASRKGPKKGDQADASTCEPAHSTGP